MKATSKSSLPVCPCRSRGRWCHREISHGGDGAPLPLCPLGEAPRLKPRWYKDLHVLWLGDLVVKRYLRPAEEQWLILEAFEEAGWPPVLDDPLPPTGGILAKRRLNFTIRHLNGCQENEVLRFMGEGTGEAICWAPLCRGI